MVNHAERIISGFGLRLEPVQDNFKNPLAGVAVRSQARRMHDLCGEITAKDPPGGAVKSRADVMLVAASDFVDGKSLRAVGEDGAVLYQGFVGK